MHTENCPWQAEIVQTHILNGTINAIVTYYPQSVEAKKGYYDNQIKILLTKIKQHGT